MKQSGRRPSRVISRRALGGLSATAVAVVGGVLEDGEAISKGARDCSAGLLSGFWNEFLDSRSEFGFRSLIPCRGEKR